MQNANKTRGVGPLGGSGMVGLWGASSLIKSIQRGTITLANASSTSTATITAVVPENCRLVLLGQSWANDAQVDERSAFVYLTFTNSTTITATRQAASGDLTVSFEVQEFNPGVIKSVQRGTIAVNGVASNTATITAVNADKSVLGNLGTQSNDGFGYGARYLFRQSLTNATTVTATRGSTTNNMISAYQVTEFF